MMCLELEFEQLPLGHWSCPKCTEAEQKAAKREKRAAFKEK
jgi:hypothetical protein